MDCPECQEREDEEKRKQAVEEKYNEGINLLRDANEKLYDANKLFDELEENPDLFLHSAEAESHDSGFSLEHFINEFNEDVHKMQRDLEMLIYEKEMEEC